MYMYMYLLSVVEASDSFLLTDTVRGVAAPSVTASVLSPNS